MPRTNSVLEQTRASVRIEGPSTLTTSDRYAIVASYGPGPQVSKTLESMVVRLEECGYTVVVSRASDNPAPLQWSDRYAGNAVVIRKPNVGYDFGSWAVALDQFPQMGAAPYVLLVNDSIVGPFASLQPIVDHFESTAADVWAATNTTQFFPHLQSFFMGFRAGALAKPGLRQFFAHLRTQTDKQKIIHEYELGLSRRLFGEAFATAACFQSERVVEVGLNPSVIGWHRLLDLGFPFVKRELITNPSLAPDGQLIIDEVQRRFGVDPRTWI